jgi:hypothetical protein
MVDMKDALRNSSGGSRQSKVIVTAFVVRALQAASKFLSWTIRLRRKLWVTAAMGFPAVTRILARDSDNDD